MELGRARQLLHQLTRPQIYHCVQQPSGAGTLQQWSPCHRLVDFKVFARISSIVFGVPKTPSFVILQCVLMESASSSSIVVSCDDGNAGILISHPSNLDHDDRMIVF